MPDSCSKREPAALDCEPAGWIASRVARNVSPAAWSFADNLSRKRVWIARRGRYDCKPLATHKIALCLSKQQIFKPHSQRFSVVVYSCISWHPKAQTICVCRAETSDCWRAPTICRSTLNCTAPFVRGEQDRQLASRSDDLPMLGGWRLVMSFGWPIII